MLNIKDLRIDLNSVGNMLLTQVTPAYDYVDGKRTDTISSYRYTVVLPKHGYEKMSVKIPGKQQVQSPDKATPVNFDQLEIGVYVANGRPQVYAKAATIHLLK